MLVVLCRERRSGPHSAWPPVQSSKQGAAGVPGRAPVFMVISQRPGGVAVLPPQCLFPESPHFSSRLWPPGMEAPSFPFGPSRAGVRLCPRSRLPLPEPHFGTRCPPFALTPASPGHSVLQATWQPAAAVVSRGQSWAYMDELFSFFTFLVDGRPLNKGFPGVFPRLFFT